MEMPAMASSTYSSTSHTGQALQQNLNQFQQGIRGQEDALIKRANQIIEKREAQPMTTPRRLVQVFVADPDENVPLDDCLLYKGDLQVTDLTDQELFFEIDIKSVLDAHNAKRTLLVDKSVKERVQHLEPARIRDLKMTVVLVAQF